MSVICHMPVGNVCNAAFSGMPSLKGEEHLPEQAQALILPARQNE